MYVAAESEFGEWGSSPAEDGGNQGVQRVWLCAFAVSLWDSSCRRCSEMWADILQDNFQASSSVMGGGCQGQLLCQVCGRLRSGSMKLEE